MASSAMEAFKKLGEWMLQFEQAYPHSDQWFVDIVQKQHGSNGWFIEPHILKTMRQWGLRFSEGDIDEIVISQPEKKRKVCVLPDPNVLFSGLHELFYILCSGQAFVCKNENGQSSLLQALTQQLLHYSPTLSEKITWGSCTDIDRYIIHAHAISPTMLQYFSKKDALLIDKKISVAIIDQSWTEADFDSLGNDLFQNFGHSPHNVRKLFLPNNFELKKLFEPIEKYASVYNTNRYANNYDYHKSILLMDRKPFFDNGFLVLRESEETNVPIGTVYFEYYNDAVSFSLNTQTHVQQIISKDNLTPGMAFSFSIIDNQLHNYIATS
jgi:hypothetical protein